MNQCDVRNQAVANCYVLEQLAMMVSMDVNHPDISDFIKIKKDLSKVTNANLSIKINDEFMQAVQDNKDYILRFPCNVNIDLDSGIRLDDLKYNILI